MAKPRLAGPRAERRRRIFEGQAREAMIQKTAAVLKMATLSKFEFEGTCRASLRQALVLDGHRWELADLEAKSIVTAALDAIGAVRPTDLEAKPEYTTPRENCQRCGRQLDDEDVGNHRRYCSNECRESARMYRYDLFVITEHLARASAAYLASKATLAPKCCEQCGRTWNPATADARYCSTLCARLARDDVLDDRDCEHCGNTFHPRSRADVGKYCSVDCANAAKTTIFPRPCAVCGRVFTPQRDSQTACSRDCSRVEPGKLPPIACLVCGELFAPKTAWSKFCTPTCRRRRGHDLERDRAALARAAPPSPRNY